MKILRITTSLDFGGQEKQYISFTEEKKLHKNLYVFAAIGRGGFASDKISERGFEVKVFNSDPSIKNLKNIFTLYKWIKKQKPDLVHTAAAEANFHGIIAANLAKVPIIIAEEIGIPKHSISAKVLFKLLYRYTQCVICVSNAVKDYLIKIKEVNTYQCQVIYNPISKMNINNVKKNNIFTIVSVGRLEKIKNYQFLIKTLSKLDMEYILYLVGDGSEKETLIALAKNLNILDKIKFVGFSAMPELYLEKSHLFILPSLSEGFGIAVLEAMQLGLPCLCSEVGGIPEFIQNNENGWLFNPLNEEELLFKLKSIINMEQDRFTDIGQKAKITASKFSTENYIQRLEKLYNDLQ